MPPVDFISAATVFVGLQCPLKKTGLESHAAVLRGERKKKKKSESFSDAKTRKEKKRGHREPGLRVTKTLRGSFLSFQHIGL